LPNKPSIACVVVTTTALGLTVASEPSNTKAPSATAAVPESAAAAVPAVPMLVIGEFGSVDATKCCSHAVDGEVAKRSATTTASRRSDILVEKREHGRWC
jgi:hypothetical protein